MKLKTHILPAFICATIAAISPTLRAQDAPAPAVSGTSAPSPGAGQGEHHKGGGNPMERLTKALDLTDDQQAKLKPILEDRHDKMKALHDDASLTADQKKEKGKALMDATNEQIKAILTPDQVTKYEKMMADMKAHREQQASSPAASPAN